MWRVHRIRIELERALEQRLRALGILAQVHVADPLARRRGVRVELVGVRVVPERGRHVPLPRGWRRRARSAPPPCRGASRAPSASRPRSAAPAPPSRAAPSRAGAAPRASGRFSPRPSVEQPSAGSATSAASAARPGSERNHRAVGGRRPRVIRWLAWRKYSDICRKPGPTTMISMATKMRTVGKSILSGALFACSSALWSRRSRMPSACTRSVSARPVPKRSVWISIATSEPTSCTPVRSASARSASVVLLPARVSKLASSNSADEDRMRGAEVLRHALEARVDAEARLHAHDHQVERVGQREPEVLLARLDLLVEPVARRDQADPGRRAQRGDELELLELPGGRRQQHEQRQQQREHHAAAHVRDHRRLAAVARVGEPAPHRRERSPRSCFACLPANGCISRSNQRELLAREHALGFGGRGRGLRRRPRASRAGAARGAGRGSRTRSPASRPTGRSARARAPSLPLDLDLRHAPAQDVADHDQSQREGRQHHPRPAWCIAAARRIGRPRRRRCRAGGPASAASTRAGSRTPSRSR